MKIFFLVFSIYLVGNVNFKSSYKTSLDPSKINIELVKDLEIGSSDNFIFGSLGLHVDVNSLGQIFVADVQNKKIRKFSNNGQLIQLIGRVGRGPGEFLHLTDFKLDQEGQPIVLDFMLKRVTIYDTVRYDSQTTILVDNSIPKHIMSEIYPLATSTENKFLLGFTPSYSNYDKNLPKNKLYFILTEKGFSPKDTTLVTPANQIHISRRGGSTSIGILPFGRKSIIYVGPNNKIYSGWNNNLRINIYSIDGNKIQTIAKKISRVDIRSSDIDEGFKDKKLMHDYFPAYDWFVVDNKSRIWVAVNTEDRENYSLHIFNKDGELLDKTSLPKSVELQVVGDGYAYGVQEADNGIQTVVRYKINGLGG